MKVLITGATGLIGKELGKALVTAGHELIVISRHAAKARLNLPYPCKIIEGDLSTGPLQEHRLLNSLDAVINLAGESIGEGHWTEARKRRIYESRILGTRHLIKSLPVAPRIFVNASAVGYYGSQGNTELSEQTPAGDDFLAHVCQDWEKELAVLAPRKTTASPRVVALRTAMVLSDKGGALDKLLPLFRRGFGGVLGNGQQWMSWIHIEDVVCLILHILHNDSIRGPVNLVSPHCVRNEEFTKTLAAVLGVRLAPRVPALALRTALGKRASLLLSSQKAVPAVAQQSGYKFLFPELKAALEKICHSGKNELFVAEQYLPWKPEEIFPFFQLPGHLQKIIPPEYALKILSGPVGKMDLGCQLTYQLKVHGLGVKWKTLITQWQPPHHFTDIQMEGPYRLWEHSHEFRSFADGTLLMDQVYYRLPLGSLGNMVGGALARAEIEKVFQYRREHLLENLQKQMGLTLPPFARDETEVFH